MPRIRDNDAMTLSSRNRVLTILLVSGFLTAAVLAGVLLWILHFHGVSTEITVHSDVLFWFIPRNGYRLKTWEVLLPIVFLLPVGLVALAYFRQVFRKTTAPEAWFYCFFSFFFLLDGVRVLQVLLLALDTSYLYGAFLTRGILFLRFAALLSLFVASLYALDFPYQRVGSIMWGTLGLALVFAALVPLDTQRLDASLLYGFADEKSLGFVFLGFSALTLINYLLGVIKRGFLTAWPLLAGAVLLTAAWQVCLFSSFWSPLALLPGLFLLGRKAQEWYLFR